MFRLLTGVLLLLFTFTTFASLLVTPSRLAFSEKDRTLEVILVNSASTPKSYRLEFTNMKQNPTGGYTQLSEQELEAFPRADKFLRFSPRRVTLQAGESQKIKVMVRRSRDMEEPEYRSHLRFTALPDDLVGEEETGESSSGVQMKLNLLLSYSIPVIVRTQPPKSEVSIANIEFQNNEKQSVSFQMHKKAENSVHGDFTVFHTVNGVEEEVGYLNGLNMFRETKTQYINIPMVKPLSTVDGKLRIEYKGKSEFSDKDLAIAEISF